MKTNENLNVSCTLSEEAPGMLFGNEHVIKNLFRSKHIASLNEMTFCIMSFLLFLPKTDLKHSRAQYEKSMFLLLFTVVLSTSLSGNENQNLSLVAFKPHSFWYQKHVENQSKLSTGSKSNPVCCHTHSFFVNYDDQNPIQTMQIRVQKHTKT